MNVTSLSIYDFGGETSIFHYAYSLLEGNNYMPREVSCKIFYQLFLNECCLGEMSSGLIEGTREGAGDGELVGDGNGVGVDMGVGIAVGSETGEVF